MDNTGIQSTTMELERRRYANSTSVAVARNYRISWGAVIAGVVVGTAIQILLGILGVGVGASTVDPMQEANPMAGLGMGAVIWLFASMFIAYYISGWISGRLSGLPTKSDGAWHGLVTWALSTVLMLMLLTSTIGSTFSGLGKMLGGIVQMGQGSGLSSVISDEIRSRGMDLGGGNEGANIGDQANQAANQFRDAAQNPQVQQRITQVGEKAAQRASAAGFGAFLLLALSGALCAWGGSMGAGRLIRYGSGKAV